MASGIKASLTFRSRGTLRRQAGYAPLNSDVRPFMLDTLRNHIYLLLALLVGVPATLHFLVVPLWRAHREQSRTESLAVSGRRRGLFITALAFGLLVGWLAFNLISVEQLLVAIVGLMVVVVALGWYLVFSGGAFQFGSWHPFFGFGRPIPNEMAKPIQSPIVVPIVLFLAGGLLGLIFHMLTVAKA